VILSKLQRQIADLGGVFLGNSCKKVYKLLYLFGIFQALNVDTC